MGTPTWRKFVSPCWRPKDEDEGENSRGGVIQANMVLEDHSQLVSGPMSSSESGPHGTFVGIYDGHAGPEASRFIRDHLFENIKKFTSDSEEMSANVIKNAYLATEEEFLSLVRKQWEIKPQMGSVGSCCLVGIICHGLLYIANAGDSRVVLGRLCKTEKVVKAIQLSAEHNANLESVREELHSLHPDDPQIVVLKHNVWRVRGLIQVSRSIGDAYLKEPSLIDRLYCRNSDSQRHSRNQSFWLSHQYWFRNFVPEDLFLIFASDGLWEHLTNQEAVDLVNSSPRNGIARRLVKAALHEAAKKREMRYSDLKKIERGVRRHFQ